jgi:hypothetical protein
MRTCLLLTGLAAGLFVATPAAAQAQAPTSAAAANASMNEAGAWVLRISDALELSHDAYRQASPKMQALTANLKSPEQAKAAGAQLRRILAPVRAAIAQSNAALDQIGPAPAELDKALATVGLSGAKLIADAKEQNSALDRLHKMVERMGTAMSAGDAKMVMALAPRMMEGAFALIDNQAMLVRNRQVLVNRKESTHQSLGVMRVLYLGMSISMRAAAAVEMYPGQTINLGQSRDDMVKLAGAVDDLAAEGRRNLAREQGEIAEMQRQVDRNGSADEKAQIARYKAVYAIEQDTFAVADDLAGLLRQNANRLSQPAAGLTVRAVVSPFESLENRLVDITRRQAQALSGAQ